MKSNPIQEMINKTSIGLLI